MALYKYTVKITYTVICFEIFKHFEMISPKRKRKGDRLLYHVQCTIQCPCVDLIFIYLYYYYYKLIILLYYIYSSLE